MKMIKKITAVTAALAAAASMSAVAFAANDFTATYDKKADTVSVDVNTLDATLAAAGKTFSDQITVVVVPNGAETIDSSNIYYIDQDSVANKSTLLTAMGVLAGSMKAGNTYEVRIGCTEGDIYKATFTVPSDTPSYPLGDANKSGDLTAADGALALNAAAGNVTLDEVAAKCADANKSGDLTAADGALILNAAAGNTTLSW